MISIVLNQRKNQNMLKRKKKHCLACEKKTDNKNIKGVALENKVGQQC